MKQKLSLAFLMVLALFLVLTTRAQALGSGRVDGYANIFLTGSNAQPVGADVAIVPDMNGDGYDELAIGGSAPNRVYLVLGGPDGWGLNLRLASAPSVVVYTGDTPGDLAGYTVSGVGDVNGDGFGDMLVGAPFNDIAGSNAGAVYVVLGSATLTGSNLGMFPIIVGEVASDEAGRTIGPAGDVNGDGYQDMLVGVMGHDTPSTNAGAVYLVPGAANITSAILNSSKIKYTGEATNDYAGRSVDGIGDMNGDGYMDFIVGAPGNDDGASQAGSAYVVLGSASPTNSSLTIHLQYSSTIFVNTAGQEVSGAGDFNGDGYDDVMIGAPGSDTPGLYLVLGSATPAGSSLASAIFYSGTHGNNSLTQTKYLAQAGDINGDGFGDVLIGSESENSSTGAVYVAYGTANPVNTTLSSLTRLGGAAAGDLLGSAVNGNGDSNGDGLADVILNTLSNDEGGTNAGGAYVLFGETSAQAYRERQRLNNTGNLPAILFDTIGIGVDFTANALAGGDVTVTRHLFHPCGTDIRLQTPIWTVDSPKIGAGTTFNLRLQYTTDQIVGMDENTLRVWTRPIGQPCAEWVQVGSSAVNVNTNLITATGLSSAGQYTVSASDTPPSPTAIQEQALTAYPAQSPAELMLILTVLALSSGTTYTYLRRRQRHDDTRQKPGFLL